jgi:hypothetical protein
MPEEKILYYRSESGVEIIITIASLREEVLVDGGSLRRNMSKVKPFFSV